MMKEWLVAYIRDNYNNLMRADIKLARLLGAPQGATLSGHAYVMEQQDKLWGKLWRPVIDLIFKRLFGQEKHCEKAHAKDVERAKLL
jgi:hypothetical protein